MLRERDVVSKDVGEGLIPVLAFEWRGTVEHLVYQYTERPPIHCACVSTPLDHFRSDIFFGSNEAVRPKIGNTRFSVDSGETTATDGTIPTDYHGGSAARAGLFRKVKVRKHYMARLMKEDILGRKIS